MKSVAAISSSLAATIPAALARLGAASLQRGQHFEAVIGEPLSDGGAHHAGRDDGDERIHGSFSDLEAALRAIC
jgi:hypothetical protein